VAIAAGAELDDTVAAAGADQIQRTASMLGLPPGRREP